MHSRKVLSEHSQMFKIANTAHWLFFPAWNYVLHIDYTSLKAVSKHDNINVALNADAAATRCLHLPFMMIHYER